MTWVTYEEFNGYDWEIKTTSCTSCQVESLKARGDIIIIRIEKVRII